MIKILVVLNQIIFKVLKNKYIDIKISVYYCDNCSIQYRKHGLVSFVVSHSVTTNYNCNLMILIKVLLWMNSNTMNSNTFV